VHRAVIFRVTIVRRAWDERGDNLLTRLAQLESQREQGWDQRLSLQIDQIHSELDEYGYFDTHDKIPGAEDR
jgi:hypothetical protein